MLSNPRIIEIYKALADPNRLQLFQLLLASDRTNSELMRETGLSQNLLSHHLSVLTECGLVNVQQSIGDARRRYYSPNLDAACQVGQWWRAHSPADVRPLPALHPPRRVLFLCFGNAARSLIAEALAHHLAPDALIAHSAGVEPRAHVPPYVPRILAEFGVPSERLVPKTYHELEETRFDYMITVCDIVHEHEISLAFGGAVLLHWSLHDPVEMGEIEGEEGQLQAMRALYHAIEQRLALFVQRLARQDAEA